MPHRPSPHFPFRALLLSLSAGLLVALPLMGATCSPPKAQFEDVNALGGEPPPGVVGVNVVASCPIPTPGGPIDSAAVAVGDRNDLRVILTAPAPVGGTLIELTSQDPSIATAGDPRQGFVTQVFVPEGGQVSNSFDIFGVKVGLTQITGQDLTSQFVVLNLTVVVWDLGNGGTERLYDANTPNNNHCRNIDQSPNLSQDPNKLAVCGRRVKGVVADGVSNLLLRTRSGLAGTVCFDLLPTTSQDPGSITDSVVTTQTVAGTNQATSFYTAPADYEEARPRRFVDLEAVFIPLTGNPSPNLLRTKVEVVAPPTVAIHGVWSERGGWSVAYEDRTDSFRTVTLADYKPTNQREFANNIPRIRAFLDKALIFQRLKGYAATQADVVAHSMGGILTRHHMLDPSYLTPDTYGQGDVNKLVLLNSPQLGSNLANALVRIHSIAPTKAGVIGTALGGRTDALTGGAVCDLAENSPAFNASTALSVPVHAVTATGGPPGTPTIGAQLPVSLEVALAFLLNASELQTLDFYRFRDLNDAIVTLASQQSGLPAAAQTDFPNLTHATIDLPGVTSSSAVAARAFDLFAMKESDPVFAAGFPAVVTNGFGDPTSVPGIIDDRAVYLAQCGAGGPMRTAGDPGPNGGPVGPNAGLATITAPLAGTVVAPGDVVDVSVTLDPSFITDTAVAVVASRLESFTPPTIGSDFQVVIPNDLAGDVSLDVFYFDAGGAVETAQVTLHVQPSSAPISLRVDSAHALALPTAPGGEERVVVQGVYSDGTIRDLSDASTGTIYASTDTGVAVVGTDGVLNPVGEGLASIQVTQGALQAFTTVVVGEPLSASTATINVNGSVQVTRSGLRLDRTTGFFVQDVQVTNGSSVPALGPLWVVVSNLTSDVDWVDSDGPSEVSDPGQPAGRLLPADGLALSPGETTVRTLRFLNPNRSPIDYLVDVVQGPRP